MTARTGPLFTVVIATRNRPEQLSECLTCLSRQELPRTAFEVILVDDGGQYPLDDIAAGFADALDLTLLRQPQSGAAAARNRGIAAARGKVLAFTDDDCRPAADWLPRLGEQFAAADADLLVGGCVRNALSGNPFAATSQLIHELAYAHHNTADGARFFASNNMAVSAAALVRLGGFDARFSVASEDRDLCARWRERGYALRYAPEAQVQHANQLTLRRFWAQHFRYGRGAWLFHRSLRRRGNGRFARDLGFHARFLRRARQALGRQEHSRSMIGVLLIVWQTANLAGFLYEAVRERLISRRRATKIS